MEKPPTNLLRCVWFIYSAGSISDNSMPECNLKKLLCRSLKKSKLAVAGGSGQFAHPALFFTRLKARHVTARPERAG